MIKGAFRLAQRAHANVLGKAVTTQDQPQLWQTVTAIAHKLSARMPTRIVLGIEPNFYVTAADVSVFPGGKTHSGETLYISLPVLRMLTPEEFHAVIGHELGHFKGDDTKYSLKFYPIYAGTARAIGELSGGEGASQLALLPALATLSFFLEQFSKAESGIGRQREFEADKVGASASSGAALGVALLKIGAVAPMWVSVKKAMIDALSEGKIYTNVSEFYWNVAKSAVTPEIIYEVGAQAITHPTDTHPTTADRIQALGHSVKTLQGLALDFEKSPSAATVVGSLEEIEKEISDFEHQVLVATGAVVVPEK
jgi:Zn-dependent protease with chaperone function